MIFGGDILIYNRVLKIGVVFFIIVFLLNNSNIFVSAHENNTINNVVFDNFHKVSNELNTECIPVKNGLHVKINSDHLKKGVYTSVIYINGDYDFSNYGMISFYVSNYSKSELRMNFVINHGNDKGSVVSDNKPIIIKSDNNRMFEEISPKYGSSAIEAGFKGRVYIPFSSFEKKDKQGIISKVSSFGIIAVLNENQERSFDINNFSLINKNENIFEYGMLDFNIQGDSKVQIPVNGESISQYKVVTYNSNAAIKKNKIKYQIANAVPGIKIDNNGLLTIQKGVYPQKVTVYATINDILIQSKEIQLVKSWTLTAKEKDGTDRKMPEPNEISQMEGTYYKVFSSNKSLNTIRIISVVSVFLFAVIFISWKRTQIKK